MRTAFTLGTRRHSIAFAGGTVRNTKFDVNVKTGFRAGWNAGGIATSRNAEQRLQDFGGVIRNPE